MAAETWRAVVGFEGRYEVSDAGAVRALFVAARGRWQPGRLLADYSNGAGHRKVALTTAAGVRERRYVHRLVLEAFLGPCPVGDEALHEDDDPANNALANLRWGTHAENMGQMHRHGRGPIGVRNGHARLTDADVRAIRERVAGGETQRVVAVAFGVSQSRISYIVNGINWSHVR